MSVEGLWRTAGSFGAELEGRVLWSGVRRGCPADSLEGLDFGEGRCSAAVSHCRQGVAHQMRVSGFGVISTCWSAPGCLSWRSILSEVHCCQAPRPLLYNRLSSLWSAVCSMILFWADTGHSF